MNFASVPAEDQQIFGSVGTQLLTCKCLTQALMDAANVKRGLPPTAWNAN